MKKNKIKNTFNDIINSLCSLLRTRNVSTRLKIGFVLITVLPVLAVGYFSYMQGSNAIYNKMRHSVSETIDQVGINLGSKLQAIINDATEIAYHDLVQKTLTNYDNLSRYELNKIEDELSDYINKKYIFSYNVAEIIIYTTDLNRINAYGESNFWFMPKTENLELLVERARDLDGLSLWMPVNSDYEQGLAKKVFGDRESIILIRAVKSLETGNQIGYILMRVDESKISSTFRGIDIGAGSQLFVLNSDNIVVSTAGDYAQVALPYHEPDILNEINKASDDRSFKCKIGGDSYLATFTKIQQADWYIVALIRFDYLYSESVHLLYNIFIIGICFLLFALFLNYIMSRSIVTPIRQLVHGINSFKNGELDISIEDKNNDEFSELNRCFNEMTTEIKRLIQDIKRQETQKKELEIRALQAQINPHFLSNVLNTVSYIASVKKEDNIVKLVDSIVNLLNGCMKNDNSQITVEEEISLLKSYITMQEYRLFGRFSVEFNIDSSVLSCLVPRFLLQPILENALIHGIEPSCKKGLIVIKGFRQDDRLYFSITDNGIGMSQEQIDLLLQSDDHNRNSRLHGIGISNTQDRIKLLYGPKYGLEINSVKGVFTTVNICLPFITVNKGGE
ncbi:MAG: sensor histidine kinase [Clostridiaceae bacterium]|nr:sensor histidine kinase [Clostridiaceae bacterium]